MSDSAEQILLRTSSTMWYCAVDYRFRQEEPVSLVLLDEPSNFRELTITLLNEAGIPWRILPMSRLHFTASACCGEGRCAPLK
ncbi:MAG: hypothetical protein ACR5LD_03295 [Symbiopectobacterium sp.]